MGRVVDGKHRGLCRQRCGRAAVAIDGRAAGVVENPLGLARMQLGIDRHGGGAKPPDAVEHLEIVHPVLHEHADPVAGCDAVACRQAAGDCGGAAGEFAIIRDLPLAGEKRRRLRTGARGSVQPFGEIHECATWP